MLNFHVVRDGFFYISYLLSQRMNILLEARVRSSSFLVPKFRFLTIFQYAVLYTLLLRRNIAIARWWWLFPLMERFSRLRRLLILRTDSFKDRRSAIIVGRMYILGINTFVRVALNLIWRLNKLIQFTFSGLSFLSMKIVYTHICISKGVQMSF